MSESIRCLMPQRLNGTAYIILFIWITHNIIQRLNDFFLLRVVIKIVGTVNLDMSSCCIFYTEDNIDGLESVIFKMIFVNYKLIPDLLDAIFYCNITINLAIQQEVCYLRGTILRCTQR